MDLSSQLFFMELITTATGSMVLLLWQIFQKPFLRVNPKMVFITVHVVLLMCLIPVGYLLIRLNMVDSYIRENGFVNLNFQRTQALNYGFAAILAIWILLGINRLIKYGRKIAGDIGLRRGNVPEDKEEALELFEELKDRLGISEKVVLEENDMIRTPCAMGILHPCVMLPYSESGYSRKELEMILSHELLHIKSHDIWYKLFTAFIVGIQCFNPLIFVLFKSMGLFCENRCDARVDETMQESFSQREYFDFILALQLQMQEEDEEREKKNRRKNKKKEKENDMSFLTSMLVRKSSLERRVEFMKIYHKGKVSKAATAALAVLFIVSSTFTAVAASVEISELHDQLYKTTDPIVQVFDEDGNEVPVHKITAEESAGTNIVYTGDFSNPLMRGSQSFNWSVDVNTRSVTSKFNLASGVEISVTASVRPTDSTFWMGVMYDKDGTGWYIEAKKAAAYTFKVNKNGAYRAFVENRSDVKITASGSYNYD